MARSAQAGLSHTLGNRSVASHFPVLHSIWFAAELLHSSAFAFLCAAVRALSSLVLIELPECSAHGHGNTNDCPSGTGSRWHSRFHRFATGEENAAFSAAADFFSGIGGVRDPCARADGVEKVASSLPGKAFRDWRGAGRCPAGNGCSHV